jgi:hypothetical protein
MKLALSILFILLIGSAFAVGEYGCVFLSIEPSNINRAMGDGVGVVNIWHDSPLTSYSNPAIAAFREGVSYGVINDNWLEGSEIDDMYYNCGVMNIAYQGIGLTLPAANRKHDSGIMMDYGTQYQYDDMGDIIGSFNSFDEAPYYGLAVNPLVFLHSLNSGFPVLRYLDLALGVNKVKINSFLGTEQDASGDVVNRTAKSTSTNLGVIAKVNHITEYNILLEGVLGLSAFNILKDDITYIRNDQKATVYLHRNQGIAFSASLLADEALKGHINPGLIFFKSFLTGRALASMIEYPSDERIYSYGAELGLLDTVYGRYGRYEDKAGHITGTAYGYGINLHYKDIISYSYNYSSSPGGELVDRQKASDHNVMFNPVSIYKLISNNK